MGSGLASITWYGEDIMSIVTLGFVVAAISAADLLAEFLKLTLTMILSPDAKTSLSATDEELYNTISSVEGFCVTVLCCLLFFLAFFGLYPRWLCQHYHRYLHNLRPDLISVSFQSFLICVIEAASGSLLFFLFRGLINR